MKMHQNNASSLSSSSARVLAVFDVRKLLEHVVDRAARLDLHEVALRPLKGFGLASLPREVSISSDNSVSFWLLIDFSQNRWTSCICWDNQKKNVAANAKNCDTLRIVIVAAGASIECFLICLNAKLELDLV